MRSSLFYFIAGLFVLSFVSVPLLAQEIKGRIISEPKLVEGVSISNSRSQQTTVSDANGLFSIEAKEGDVLIFSSMNLESIKRRLTNADVMQERFNITMVSRTIELNEVIIDDSPKITAEGLGIIPNGQKKYTPAERKLYTAKSTNVDQLINYFSGRTEMLKKEVEIEKKERVLARFITLFEENYYTKTLEIPLVYIRDFQYYCVDDSGFVGAIQSKNKTLTMFLIIKLAEKYKELKKDEK